MDPVARGIAALHAAGITVVDHHGWGATVDYPAMARRPIDPTRGQRFVHWLGTPTTDAAVRGGFDAVAAALRSAERYHLSLGWAGLAYDLAVDNAGRAWQIRGDAQSAATSGDVDMDGIPNNVEGDAILFVVGAGQQASPAALDTAALFLDAHGAGPVHPHHDARGTATSCPGPQLSSWATDYRRTVVGTRHYDAAVVGANAVDVENGRSLAQWLRLGLIDIDERQPLDHPDRYVALAHPRDRVTITHAILVGAAAGKDDHGLWRAPRRHFERVTIVAGADRDATALEVAELIHSLPRRQPGDPVTI